MNGSCVTPNTAGIESMAKTRSESSMTTRTSSSGVAIFTPAAVFASQSADFQRMSSNEMEAPYSRTVNLREELVPIVGARHLHQLARELHNRVLLQVLLLVVL